MTSPTAPGLDSTRQIEPGTEQPSAELVLAQLGNILQSAVFRNSKRYAAVLRYIVEQTLNGNADQLKERTIGVDVFGRMPDYDTASDHVVRSAMAEVRKRLAHYYAGAETGADLHIELQPGSYVPIFRVNTALAEAVPALPQL